MAWIKLRTDLADDPAVISMSSRLRIDRFGIVGRLHCVWSWATDQLVDGNAPGVTGAFLDQKISTPGFAASMAKVGWLVVSREGITFPKWDTHLSNGAKNRALTARRVEEHRKTSNAPIVTKSLPEQSRADKNESAFAAGSSPSHSALPALPTTGREALKKIGVGEPALEILSPIVSSSEVLSVLQTVRQGRRNYVGVVVSELCKLKGVSLPKKSPQRVGSLTNGVLAKVGDTKAVALAHDRMRRGRGTA